MSIYRISFSGTEVSVAKPVSESPWQETKQISALYDCKALIAVCPIRENDLLIASPPVQINFIPVWASIYDVLIPHVITTMSLNFSRYLIKCDAVEDASSMITSPSFTSEAAFSARLLLILYMCCSRAESAILVFADILFAITLPCVRRINCLFSIPDRSRRIVGSLTNNKSANYLTEIIYFFSKIVRISFSLSSFGIDPSMIYIIMY